MIDDKKVKKESLFMVKFLDVVGGLCTHLCALALYHRVSALSIEKCPKTLSGSFLHLENAMVIVSIPFVYW